MKRLRRAAGKAETVAGGGSLRSFAAGAGGSSSGGGGSGSNNRPRAITMDVISRFVVGAMRFRVELEEEEETFTKTSAALKTARRSQPS
jgi:hypothetical protein